MEKFYLDDEVLSFKTDEFDYIVSFEKMEQQNLDKRYLTQRKVRRRPEFQSCVQTVERSAPSHWPKNCLPGQRITAPAEKYKILEKEFKSSIKVQVDVLNIEEVCNEEYYEKYEGKKRSLLKKLGEGKMNEQFLYHGTDDKTVSAVCAQNFDFRLCGKNATAYGDGSYFARHASYSHSYTSDDRTGVRYMFVASVLVGRFTKGCRGLKRPPVITTTEHDLYDSCVNNINDPSIFIIFERDQCYPKYVISYRVTPAAVAPPAVVPSAATPRTVASSAVASHRVTPAAVAPPAVVPNAATPRTVASSADDFYIVSPADVAPPKVKKVKKVASSASVSRRVTPAAVVAPKVVPSAAAPCTVVSSVNTFRIATPADVAAPTVKKVKKCNEVKKENCVVS